MNLEGIFGKPWFKSMTAWGLVLWIGVDTIVTQLCGGDLPMLAESTCTMILAFTEPIGQALTVLGIRRKMT